MGRIRRNPAFDDPQGDVPTTTTKPDPSGRQAIRGKTDATGLTKAEQWELERLRNSEATRKRRAADDNGRYNEADKAVQDAAQKRLAAEAQARQQQYAMLSQVYDDPRRQQYYQALYGSTLRNGLNSVYDQGANDLRGAAFNAADRGVLGGSTDIEKRGDVQRSVNAGALNADQQAYSFVHGVQQNDTDKQVNLMRLIESSNPDSQAAFTQQLRGITQAQQGYLQQNQIAQQGRQLDQFNQNARSQLVGNALGYAGTQYQTDQNARAYGGRGLSYLDFGNSGSSQGVRS